MIPATSTLGLDVNSIRPLPVHALRPVALRETAAARTALVRTALGLLLLILLLTRPMSPWWLSADCDANYVASSVNLLLGQPTEKLDHPGLPLQILLAVSLAADHAVRSIHSGLTLEAYADAVLHDMTPVLWIVRAWAMVFTLAAMLMMFEVCRRLSGSIGAGVIGVVLWAACPGSLSHATGFRPEATMNVLSLGVLMGLCHAVRTCSPQRLLASCAALGAAITIKVHAVALIPLAALALFWVCLSRGRATCVVPEPSKRVIPEHAKRVIPAKAGIQRSSGPSWIPAFAGMTEGAGMTGGAGVTRGEGMTAKSAATKRAMLAACAVGGVVTCLWMNARRPTPSFDGRLLVGVGWLLAWLGASIAIRKSVPHRAWVRIAADPLIPATALAGMAGALLANAWVLDEVTPLARSLWWTVWGAENRGALDTTTLADSLWRQWTQTSLLPAAPLLGLILVGAWRARHEHRVEAIFFGGAFGLMFLLAMLRGAVHPSPHHYGPALVMGVPLVVRSLTGITFVRDASSTAFWRNRAFVRRAAPALAAMGLSAWPIVAYERSARGQALRCQAIAELSSTCVARLETDEVVLCDYWAQDEDACHFMQVRDYAWYCPDRPYRSLPDTPPGLRYAQQRRLRPAYYLTSGSARTRVERDQGGRLVARGAWGSEFLVAPLEDRTLGGLHIEAYRILGRPTGKEDGGRQALLD